MKPGKVLKHCKKMPLMSVPFPPTGYYLRHKVSTGENWSSLAVDYQREDVWDIIFFNFRTYDAKEVNYYLEELVGSKYTTDDGKNYVFHSTDSPGYLYIPPQDWRPGDKLELSAEDRQLRDKVLNILHSSYLNKIRFVNPNNHYTYPGLFKDVAGL